MMTLMMSLWLWCLLRSCCVRPCRPSADTPVFSMSFASANVSSSLGHTERLHLAVEVVWLSVTMGTWVSSFKAAFSICLAHQELGSLVFKSVVCDKLKLYTQSL